MSAVTAVTAQNTMGVSAVHALPLEMVGAQIDAVAGDIGVDAVKTGMLLTPNLVRMVTEKVTEYKLDRLVVDPAMVAKGGAVLLTGDARQTLRDILLPLALVVTPNVPEAEVLAEMEIRDAGDMKEAARRIFRLGARTVIIKGGHLAPTATGTSLREDSEGNLPPDQAIDIFYDGKEFTALWGPRFKTKNTHGTGCSFSAAITAELAKGTGVRDAVLKAKEFISAAIEHSLDLGSGHGPTNPWAGARRAEPTATGGDGI